MKFTALTALIVPVITATNSLSHFENITTNINVHFDDIHVSSALAAQKATARALIDAYNAWDIEAIMENRSPHCQQQALPSSMGKPAKDNVDYRRYFESIMPLFSNFTITVHQEFHDPDARMSFMHASSAADTKIGPYTNEYALSLSFTEDGTEITKIDEFVDSAYSAKFFAKLAIPA
jgi:ketosteroid isomerase-like protein